MTDTVIVNGHDTRLPVCADAHGRAAGATHGPRQGETRPYYHFMGRKVYLRSVGGSKHFFETTRDQDEHRSD